MAVRPSGTTKYRDPSPPGTRGRAIGAAKMNKQTSRGACLKWRAAERTLEFALSSAPGSHQAVVPSDRPRALGRARPRASPGIRVSRSGRAGKYLHSRAEAGEQKTLRSVGSGGSVTTDLKNSFSDEFPPALFARMSRRRVAATLHWVEDQIGHLGFTHRFRSIPNRRARYFIWWLASSELVRAGLPIFCNQQTTWQERHKRRPLSRLRERARVRVKTPAAPAPHPNPLPPQARGERGFSRQVRLLAATLLV